MVTPDYLELIIRKKKKECQSNPLRKRFNFNKALDEVKAVLNWHKENYDYRFPNPVLKRHYNLGIIRKPGAIRF